MKLIIRILAFIALLISSIWLYYEQDFEPALTTVVSLSALISTYLFGKEGDSKKRQQQKVGNKSTAIQAGGDVKISIGDSDKC